MAYNVEYTLRGVAPYSQSRRVEIEQQPNKSREEVDRENYLLKAHVDDETGEICIPAFALKHAINTAAARAADKIKGKGNQTYAKNVQSGVLPLTPVCPLGIKIEDVKYVALYQDAMGKKGKTKSAQVMRHFPIVPSGWKAKVSFLVTDEELPADKLHKYVKDAGTMIGIGRWRPEVGGMNGRFVIDDIKVTPNG
jgi:hypothetical protein